MRKREHISHHRASLEWLTIEGRHDCFAATLLYRLFEKDSKLPQFLRVRYLPNDSTRPTRGERYRLSLKNTLSDHFTSRLLICGIFYHQRYEIAAHYLCYIVVFEIAISVDIYFRSHDMLCILQ